MNTVSIKLVGGLGNYMFQIACAYAYGLKHNKKPVFATDDSVVIHKHLSNYENNILKNVELIRVKNNDNCTVYNELEFKYNEIPELNGDVYLNGYFQSDKYFKEYTNEIKRLFSYPQEINDKVINKMISEGIHSSHINTCSIHVRRGDYLNSPNHHPAQNMNYYMKAIKQMPKDSVFFIFSDDIAWCKQNFPDLPEKFKFVEGNSDFEDLLMMSICKNNIICNSTFSWWAAWLNNNPDKKIIIPAQWFGPAYSHYNTEDIYCENWIKI